MVEAIKMSVYYFIKRLIKKDNKQYIPNILIYNLLYLL